MNHTVSERLVFQLYFDLPTQYLLTYRPYQSQARTHLKWRVFRIVLQTYTPRPSADHAHAKGSPNVDSIQDRTSITRRMLIFRCENICMQLFVYSFIYIFNSQGRRRCLKFQPTLKGEKKQYDKYSGCLTSHGATMTKFMMQHIFNQKSLIHLTTQSHLFVYFDAHSVYSFCIPFN